jgi:8-oxo-dGTP pyrophosphatase MutT (NUDIX family)
VQDPPDDLPLVRRRAVRLVVLDAERCLLLLHTREFTRPSLGSWWELPGGGIDPGETISDTAIRELREETGLVIGAEQVGPPIWRRTSSFLLRDTRRVQEEVIVRVTLTDAAPRLDVSGQEPWEREDYLGFRWWPPSAVVADNGRFYPGRLPELLPAFLDGQQIDEPFELWS